MLNKIQRIRIEDWFNIFEQDSTRLDVVLCQDDGSLAEMQNLLEDDRSFVLVSLDDEDLHDKRSILESLYQVLFDELPEESQEILEIIEALEDEIGDEQSCVLIIENFSSCSLVAQAALLELVIVSRAFKLLLRIEEDFNFYDNERLWNVLVSRSSLLEPSEETYEDFEDELHITPKAQSSKQLPWYQLIPKYHFLAGILLAILVLALWNMDLSQKKEQKVELDFNKKIITEEKEILLVNAEKETLGQDNIMENPDQLVEEDIDVDPEKSEVQPAQNISSETKIEAVPIKAEIPPREVEKESSDIVESSPKIKLVKKVDWAPYQSNAWIKGLNNKYYTLQLMASHDDQGIRSFLKERGVSSQYAVFTTEKNGKPWHVIIYGVYENHNFADLARKELPDYLKNYSPWVRTISDVQNSLK